MLFPSLLAAAVIASTSAAPLDASAIPGTYTIASSPDADNVVSSLTNSDGTFNFTAGDAHIARVLSKYAGNAQNYLKNTGSPLTFAGPAQPLPGLTKRATELEKRQQASYIVEPMVNHANTLWTGNLNVGIPTQSFPVSFDSGSADAWVIGYNTTTSWYSTVVDPNPQAFQLQYGDGSTVSGPIWTEYITVAGTLAQSQTFSPVAQSTGFTGSAQQGIIGLGYQSISAMNTQNLLNTLYQQSQVAAPQFAVKISPSGSLITLGGYNASSIKGQPTWTPVTNQAYWSVRGYVWPNSAINSTQYDFIVDTGTSVILASPPVAKAYFATMSNFKPYPPNPAYYQYPCSQTIRLAYSLAVAGLVPQSTKPFTIPPAYLNLGQTYAGSPTCIAAVLSVDFGYNGWVIGAPLLRAVLSIYDFSKNAVAWGTLL